MEEKQIASLLEFDRAMQLEVNIEEISEYYDKNNEKITGILMESFQNIFKKASELQNQRRKGPASILAISFLRTFIMEKDYRLRMDLYDKSFILSKTECCGYLDVEFILMYLDKDVDLYVGDFKDCGVKFKGYEVDELKKSYINHYVGLLQTFITMNIAKVIGLEEFKLLTKEENFKIIFGEYLDNSITIYDSTAESEAK